MSQAIFGTYSYLKKILFIVYWKCIWLSYILPAHTIRIYCWGLPASQGGGSSFLVFEVPALLLYLSFLSLMELETKAKRSCFSKEPKYRTGVGKMGTGKGFFVSK